MDALGQIVHRYADFSLYCGSWEVAYNREEKCNIDIDCTPKSCFIRLSSPDGIEKGEERVPWFLVGYWRQGFYETYAPDKDVVVTEGADCAEFLLSLLGVSFRLTHWIPAVMLCPEIVPKYDYVDRSGDAKFVADLSNLSTAPPERTVEFILEPSGLLSAFAVSNRGAPVVARAVFQRLVGEDR